MEKIRLALIYGGTSSEREVSIAGGNAVLEVLDKETYQIRTYDPRTQKDIQELVNDSNEIDFAFILLHGENGEDGRIQGLLDLLKVPYQCSGVMASAIAMNKSVCKDIYKINHIPVAKDISFDSWSDKLEEDIFENIGLPVVIKPAIGGSSIALTIVEKKEDLKKACDLALKESELAMAEQYISGIELTCPVMGHNHPEALPVIEICPKNGHKFFDYEAKYKAGETEEICPARIDDEITKKVQELSIKAHTSLGCKGYSRTDFILSGEELFVLETNTVPGMTKNSLLPLSARTAGIPFKELIDKLIKLSLEL